MADFPIENTTNRDNFKLALALASTDLTDSTAAGRTLLTAASASAQRTALDVLQSSAAATAAQGALADSAVQPGDIGTAAAEDVGYFATAAQGTLASNSVQKDGGWTYSSSGGNVLIASPDTDDAANATSIPATALPRTDTSQSFTTGQKQQVAANIGSTAGAASTLVSTNADGDITVVDVSCTNLQATDIQSTQATFNLLSVGTDASVTGDLDVGVDLGVAGDLDVVGAITAGTIAGNGASITGLTSSQITDATALATANKIAKRGAAGDCAFTALTATTGTFSDDVSMVDVTASGNGSIGGTLGVTSNATVGGTLGVTGATTLSSTLAVTSNATVGGTLGVTGATTLAALSATTGTFSSTLGVTGAATLSSTLAVTDNTTVGGTLGVTGAVTLSSALSVTSNVTVGGALVVTGDTDAGNLTTSGDLVTQGYLNSQDGRQKNLTATGTNLTLTSSHHIVKCTATLTLTLPPATGVIGREYVVKNATAAETVTITPNGSETIDGEASASLAGWEYATLVSDGTNWLLV